MKDLEQALVDQTNKTSDEIKDNILIRKKIAEVRKFCRDVVTNKDKTCTMAERIACLCILDIIRDIKEDENL